MKYTVTLIILAICVPGNTYAQDKDMNVVYGDHHIFTIETPTNWINDKKAAQVINLTNFFYCADDKDKTPKSYMFANGIDKESKTENLTEFVEDDINIFLKKYPKAKYSKIEMGHTLPIINSIMISFDNLPDRYKEEVVYLETEETIIILSFAAFSEEDYQKYQKVFDVEFSGSFKYRGNNPKPFLDYMESKEK
jgi:hypothetical protein